MSPKHLVFYDGDCGLCDHIVQFILKHDTGQKFLFAPLQGTTAAKNLQSLPVKYKTLDTLVLLENYRSSQQKVYVLGTGALRILWLLGGLWKIIGWISFLPPFLYNWIYRLVAYYRRTLFSHETCLILDEKNKKRFLS